MEAEVALRSITNRLVDVNYEVTAGDRQIVDDLAEDIRDAVHEYQVSSDSRVGLLVV